jgi:hypothetical protein
MQKEKAERKMRPAFFPSGLRMFFILFYSIHSIRIQWRQYA